MINQLTPIYTVSQLNKEVKRFLETEFKLVQVQGEISNLTRSAAGHLYFTLKDEHAQIRCAFFKGRQQKGLVDIDNGSQILVHASPSLFEPRGDYQLIVHQIENAGLGDLFLQFEALKKKLQAEGLFDPLRKRALPKFPKKIAIITSPKGAAIQDILSTLAKRYPLAHIVILPSEVQGKTAPAQLISCLNQARLMKDVDVLIIARGGGSMEDLWAFNDEQLARTISLMPMPVVSGVGHETDFTICDFVADFRAPTPTGAAIATTPDIESIFDVLTQFQNALNKAINSIIKDRQSILLLLEKRLVSPQARLIKLNQQIDYVEQQLTKTMAYFIERKQHLLNQFAKTLHAISPLATLDRGYAIAMHQHKVLTHATSVQTGDLIDVRLAKGELSCTITSIRE